MLLLISGLLLGEAGACSYIWPRERNSLPADGAENVPIDVVIRINRGYIDPERSYLGNVDFTLLRAIDGREVDIEEFYASTRTIRPLNDLEPNQEYTVQLNGDSIISFKTGEEKTPEMPYEPPRFSLTKISFYRGEETTCDPYYHDLIFDFDYPLKKDGTYSRALDAGYMTVLYEVKDGVISDEPAFEELDNTDLQIYFGQESDTAQQSCFVAAYMNSLGELSEFSRGVCADPEIIDQTLDWEPEPKGCSSTQSQNLGWLSLGLGIVFLFRRRNS